MKRFYTIHSCKFTEDRTQELKLYVDDIFTGALKMVWYNNGDVQIESKNESLKILHHFTDVIDDIYAIINSSKPTLKEMQDILKRLNVVQRKNYNTVNGWSWKIFKRNLKTQLADMNIINEVIIKDDGIDAHVNIVVYGVDINLKTASYNKYFKSNKDNRRIIRINKDNILNLDKYGFNSYFYKYNKDKSHFDTFYRYTLEETLDTLLLNLIENNIYNIVSSYKGSK